MKINIQKNVLIAPELAHTLTVRVKNTGLTADDEGKKIILAGTLIGGTTDALTDRTAELTVTTSSTVANAQGVTVDDVDVTNGTDSVSMLKAGVVDIEKMPSAMQTIVTNASSLASATGLAHIIFQKGDAQ